MGRRNLVYNIVNSFVDAHVCRCIWYAVEEQSAIVMSMEFMLDMKKLQEPNLTLTARVASSANRMFEWRLFRPRSILRGDRWLGGVSPSAKRIEMMLFFEIPDNLTN